MAEYPRIGISASDSVDLDRLGLVETHLRLAVGEISRAIVQAGSAPVYGGHLQPDGLTVFLESEMDRYGSIDRPLELVVAWSEHRSMSLKELKAHREGLGLKARIKYLDQEGVPGEADRGRRRKEGEKRPVVVDPETTVASLTALRRYLVDATEARVFIGGKEQGYRGRMPGILEEAKFAIGAGQPLYLVGGFGGATATLATRLCGLENRWPPSTDQADIGPIDAAVEASEWSLSANGLSEDENRRLATTHRPSEAATLVAIGLKRTFDRE